MSKSWEKSSPIRTTLSNVAVCGIVPVAAIIPVVLAVAFRHDMGTTTAPGMPP